MLVHSYLRVLRKVTMQLKKIPGTVLLINPLRKYFSKFEDCVVVTDFDGNLTATLCLNEHMQSQMFWYGYYSRDIVLLFNNILKPGMVVIDVGANIGEVTLTAANRVGSKGKVIAFEPMGTLNKRLQNNIEVNKFCQVAAVKCGLSDHVGSAQIFSATESFHDGTKNNGLGTLYDITTRATPEEIIELDTLDAFTERRNLTQIDLIKIDIEGAELPMLKGAERVLKEYQPYLIVEIQDETSNAAGYKASDILDYLALFGYRFYTIARKGKLKVLTVDKLMAFQNVLCVPPDRLSPIS